MGRTLAEGTALRRGVTAGTVPAAGPAAAEAGAPFPVDLVMPRDSAAACRKYITPVQRHIAAVYR